MTLRQAIQIAVSSSRATRSAFIGRRREINDLRSAEHEFRPSVDVFASATTDGSSVDGLTLGQSAADAAAALRLAFRTGGQLSYRIQGSVVDADDDLAASRRYGHALSLSQPLLRGRGPAATASQRFARLSDEGAALGLEATLSDIVDATVFAYRGLLSAREGMKIAARSMESSRDLAAITDSLIEAGRLPAVERVQAETDLANQELSLLVTENATDQAELALVSLLDLPLGTRIDPIDSVRAERREIDPGEALQTLLAHNPEYRQQLLSVEAARLSVEVARNGRLPDVQATASLRQDGGVDTPWTRDWTLGLTLQHVLGDPATDIAWVDAQLSLIQAEIDLAKQEESLRIDLQQRLRNLDVAWRQLELATRALELSERQLEIEREKLRAGRSANFQVVRFQDDLQSAAIGELDARIDYANELTDFDRALGRTLEEWGIDLDGRLAAFDPFDDPRDDAEEALAGPPAPGVLP